MSDLLSQDEVDALLKDTEDTEENSVEKVPLQYSMDAYERQLIEDSLIRNHWDIVATAKDLHIMRLILNDKIKKYGLERQP